MTNSQRTTFFEFLGAIKYKDNGLGFSLRPRPHHKILSITVHDPQKNQNYAYSALEDLKEFCPIQITPKDDGLHIAAQKIQSMRIWKEGVSKPYLTYDARGFVGFNVPEGDCILELVLYKTAGTIRIHMDLSNDNRSTPKISTPVGASSNTPSQASTVNSNSTITGLQEQLTSTPGKKSSRPTIKPPHQEDTTSSVQQEPIEPQTTVGSEPSPNNAETSSEQLQQIEAIVDGLLSRLDAVDKVVDALIEQQTAHNEKQTKLAKDIEAVVPRLHSMLSK